MIAVLAVARASTAAAVRTGRRASPGRSEAMNGDEVQAVKAVVETHVGYIRDDIKRLESKVDRICTDGCELGRSNSRHIERIESSSTRVNRKTSATVAGSIGVVMYGMAEGIRWFFRR